MCPELALTRPFTARTSAPVTPPCPQAPKAAAPAPGVAAPLREGGEAQGRCMSRRSCACESSARTPGAVRTVQAGLGRARGHGRQLNHIAAHVRVVGAPQLGGIGPLGEGRAPGRRPQLCGHRHGGWCRLATRSCARDMRAEWALRSHEDWVGGQHFGRCHVARASQFHHAMSAHSSPGTSTEIWALQ